MLSEHVLKAFGLQWYEQIEPVTNGLINYNYRVLKEDGTACFLQKINTNVFKNPLHIQQNYFHIQQHLSLKDSFQMPQMVYANNGDMLYEEANQSWRCFQFIKDSYSPSIAQTPQQAYTVANCFAQFSSGLVDMPANELHIILPHFHDLDFRFQQFQTALKGAGEERKKEAAQLIDEVNKRTYLLNWYRTIVKDNAAFPLRIMHHDCKIANILFQKETDTVLCPIDLDTTQPGYFFSDIGDMIRSMVPDISEDAPAAQLHIRTDFYEAIIGGYLDTMAPHLTPQERTNIHFAGPVLVFMQAIRFLADYLNKDNYYHINYPSQNKDRAENQIQLLAQLENYLQLHA